MVSHAAIALMMALAMCGCAPHTRSTVPWKVMFGPVLANEAIVGHFVESDTAWLATAGDAIVRVDVASKSYLRTSIRPLGAGEHIWGLAKVTGAEALWTIVGRQALAQLDEAGQIVRRARLDEPHLGVFGWGRDLIFQAANLRPSTIALAAAAPGGVSRRAWGTMRTREMGFNRAASAALNLVSCGSSAGAVMPCWFPDTAALTLTDRSGESREIALEGLPHVAPEILLASENPRRPVRDAVVTVRNAIWVLGSGEPPAKLMDNRPGGWVVARYDVDGRLFRRLQLPEPARIFLRATEDSCVLLAWDGRVVEVTP